MKEKVREQIYLYSTFTVEKEFACKEIRHILDWLYMAKDMRVMDKETFEELYQYAIDCICLLTVAQF